MKTGLIFGTFDGLHDGHKAMLEQARKFVERIIVALPSDESVLSLKGRAPKFSWLDRSTALIKSTLVDEVITGDEDIGTYHVVIRRHPDVIFIGYDQMDLKKDLEKTFDYQARSFQIVTLHSYHPERYKSSLLNFI